ncbi:MAG: Smr/MutS family protein [Deltaproteobacteria bacterium]|jgi:DNA-nicking Smr family endonuclease|nr:Smr/MutS family protein [Deltaproteobacteria bacterium]
MAKSRANSSFTYKSPKPDANHSAVSGATGTSAKPGQGPREKSFQAERDQPTEVYPKDRPFSVLASLRDKLKAKQLNIETQINESRRQAKKAAKLARSKAHLVPAETQTNEKGDYALFLEAMDGVVPLPDTNRFVPKATPPESLNLLSDDNEEGRVVRELEDLVKGKAEFDFAATDELLEAKSRDLPTVVMEKLRKGLFPVQDHLDVHGFTLPEAQDAINKFISKNAYLGRTCLLLVHGRGHRSPGGIPVIKRNLEHLLLKGPFKKYVLAFTTAKPIDGGSGASYILLRG